MNRRTLSRPRRLKPVPARLSLSAPHLDDATNNTQFEDIGAATSTLWLEPLATRAARAELSGKRTAADRTRNCGRGLRPPAPDHPAIVNKEPRRLFVAQIIAFPKTTLRPLRVHSGSLHSVRVEVVDQRRPRRTRWLTQWAIQNAASFRALKGFTDASVARGRAHRFSVSRTRLVRRFLAEISELIAAGRVIVEIDGNVVRALARRSA